MTEAVRTLIRSATYHKGTDGKPGWYEVRGEDFPRVLFALANETKRGAVASSPPSDVD